MDKSTSFCLVWICFDICNALTITTPGSLGKTGTFKCGSNATIICSIPSYQLTMAWSVGTDIVASCVYLECHPTFRYSDFEFIYDTSNGTFTMIIPEVNFDMNGKNIKCDDGSTYSNIALDVKVLPDQTTSSVIEIQDNRTDSFLIVASAGCVFPSSGIYFRWFYYEEGKAPMFFKDNSANDTDEVNDCINDECGGSEVARLSNSLTLPLVKSGKEYYIQVHIIYNDTGTSTLATINSTKRYKIESGNTHSTSKGSNETNIGLIVGVSVSCSIVVIVITIAVLFLCRRRHCGY